MLSTHSSWTSLNVISYNLLGSNNLNSMALLLNNCKIENIMIIPRQYIKDNILDPNKVYDITIEEAKEEKKEEKQ